MLYKDYVKTMTGCPFCMPTPRAILENNHAYLTYSKAPYHEDHLLVIPKRHIMGILDLTPDEQSAIDTLVRTALRVLTQLGDRQCSVLVRDGKADGLNKSVDHLHFHVVPEVRLGDLDHVGHEREILTDEEIIAVTEKFSKLFAQ